MTTNDENKRGGGGEDDEMLKVQKDIAKNLALIVDRLSRIHYNLARLVVIKERETGIDADEWLYDGSR